MTRSHPSPRREVTSEDSGEKTARNPEPWSTPVGPGSWATRARGPPGSFRASGILAVFIAGILAGDLTTRAWDATEAFVRALSNLAELAVFVALGLTISLGAITDGDLWWQGLLLAALLAFVARPLVVAPLLLPARPDLG